MTRNDFVVAGLATVLLGSILSASAVDGTWTYNGNGNWGDTNKWQDGIVADGAGSIMIR